MEYIYIPKSCNLQLIDSLSLFVSIIRFVCPSVFRPLTLSILTLHYYCSSFINANLQLQKTFVTFFFEKCFNFPFCLKCRIFILQIFSHVVIYVKSLAIDNLRNKVVNNFFLECRRKIRMNGKRNLPARELLSQG